MSARPEVHPPLWLYFTVWLALVALAAGTFGLSFAHLGAWSMVVAMSIAGVKAMLVALYFMHLRWAPGSSRMALGAAVLFVALVVGVIALDAATRKQPALPPVRTSVPPA